MTDEALKSKIGQVFLQGLGFYRSEIDGIWGPLSRAAAAAWYDRDRLTIYPRMSAASVKMLRDLGNRDAELLRTLAAQILLADLKFYLAPIDGEWGPLSQSAARRWASPSDLPGLVLTPYQVAMRYLGTKEIPGKKHNGIILNWYRRLVISIFDDETPWCSTFVNFCALESGYERTGKLNARSWLDVGERIHFMDAREGDVVIFTRGTTGWEGHVAFFIRTNFSKSMVTHLGGNQGDQVSIAETPASKILGIRRLRTLDQLQGPSNKI